VIAVIFEVWPDRREDYLDIAAELRPHLKQIDGFISVERFESLTEKGKMLSLSFFPMRPPLRRGAMSPNIAPRRRRDAAASSRITGCALRA